MSITRNDNWSTRESKSAQIGAALASEVRIRILKTLNESPGINATELSQKLKRHRSTIHNHLFYLKRAELINEEYCLHQFQLFIDSKNKDLLKHFL